MNTHLLLFFLKIYLRIIAFFNGSKHRYSQVYEDNFRYMDLKEKLWWGYKALVRQIERGEKGRQLEAYFANQDLEFKTEAHFKGEHTITLTAGGDLSTSDVLSPESTTQLWDDVRPFFFSGDIICANLETPIDPGRPPVDLPRVCLTAPDLNSTPAMFTRFTDNGQGINFFSTANNHSLDLGEAGLIATLDFLDRHGYSHVGTSRTPEEQRKVPVIEKNSIRIAFLAYTYSLNAYEAIPGKEYMTNLIRLNKPGTDLGLLEEHVQSARQQQADLVVAMLHWSLEFETYPIENIIRMGHRVLECGVDIILGGHAHVAQPMEVYAYCDPVTGEQKKGFIIYSLGELLSYNASSRNSRLTWFLKLTVSKGTLQGRKKTMLTGVQVLPVYTWIRSLRGGRYAYRLLDFRKTLHMIRAGSNPHGFSKKAIRELKRLEGLLYRCLLPRNYKQLLTESDLNPTGETRKHGV